MNQARPTTSARPMTPQPTPIPAAAPVLRPLLLGCEETDVVVFMAAVPVDAPVAVDDTVADAGEVEPLEVIELVDVDEELATVLESNRSRWGRAMVCPWETSGFV